VTSNKQTEDFESMKVYISIDMEGIAGVVNSEQGRMGNPEYERARRLMTGEANAAIQGALAGGADGVLVNDSHGGMRNLLIEELHADSRIELITGSPKPFSMVQGLDETYDVAFFVGYHARAGTAYGILDHTFSGAMVAEVRLNGMPIGEVGLNAAFAGSFGVPVGLVTGDRAVCEEAQALLGDGLQTVVIKEGYGRNAARCLLPQEAQNRIRQAAERACATPVHPFILDHPITLSLTFVNSAQADMAALIPGSRRLDGRRIEYVHQDYPVVYQVFRAMLKLAS
ncbi:MAG TPA: peptidase M55, partial [Anaerolineae bacterium]|nr:peptidase M55 [Anaerolineae bacterium]